MTQDMLTSFFGWMSVVNFAFLAFATFSVFAMRDWVANLHARLFGIDPDQVRVMLYAWLALFKVLTIVFALAPYVALRLM